MDQFHLQRVEEALGHCVVIAITLAAHAACQIVLDQSMSGIGKQAAGLLLCQMPELGACSRREIAALVGLAPINRDSGMYRGKRMIGGGRKHVRHLLYMPTLVAIRPNARIRAYYQRLLAEGKEEMVAVTACTRKILIMLNAMVKNQTAWNQNTA